MDKAAVDRWLEAYVEAWKIYDREHIAALFADGVKYRCHPYDDPVEGREAVVRSWLGSLLASSAAPRPARSRSPVGVLGGRVLR